MDQAKLEEFMGRMVGNMTGAALCINAAGNPCTAQPVPIPGSHVPASLQLVGPLRGEELLVSTAQVVEDALGA